MKATQPKRSQIWSIKGLLTVRILTVANGIATFRHHGNHGAVKVSALRPATVAQIKEYLGR